ncbi:MAG: hypothetical protein RQ748_01890 [Elusimicrobiales bacterium]|nr:hypothetical protein [Elusimicrobiales bacterium]
MDRGTSGMLLAGAGAALLFGGGYIFLNLERGGVNPQTMGSFAAMLAGIVLLVIGKSRMKAADHEETAEAMGLEVKDALSLGTSDRVEMEGEAGGFRTKVSRRESRVRSRTGYVRSRYEDLVFQVEVPNPSGLTFHVGPDSLLRTPLGSLPPKLEASGWAWTDSLAVRAEPAEAAAELFGAASSAALFREFFGKVTCTLNGDLLEFEPDTRVESLVRPGEDFHSLEEAKALLDQGVEVAKLIASLPPSAPR